VATGTEATEAAGTETGATETGTDAAERGCLMYKTINTITNTTNAPTKIIIDKFDIRITNIWGDKIIPLENQKMPEGPEVTTIANQLSTLLKRKYLRRILIISGPYKENIKPPFLGTRSLVAKFNTQAAKASVAFRVNTIQKKGKFLWFEVAKIVKSDAGTKQTDTLIIGSTLGLTGHWSINNTTPYQRLQFEFADNPKTGPATMIYYCDQLSMGKLTITDRNWLEQKLSQIGPDACDAGSFTEAVFFERFTNLSTPVYMALTNPSVISGIGNILRSEIVERARSIKEFDPTLLVSELTHDQLQALYLAIVAITSESVAAGGVSEASETSYRDIYGNSGRYIVKIYKKETVADKPVKILVDSDKRKFYYT
jgi:formamidopyrimidine-DNA glycosylase